MSARLGSIVSISRCHSSGLLITAVYLTVSLCILICYYVQEYSALYTIPATLHPEYILQYYKWHGDPWPGRETVGLDAT